MTDQDADSSLEEKLIEHYHDDLPSPSTIQQELHMWKCKWKLVKKSGFPGTPSKSLENANNPRFQTSYTSALNFYIACDK